MKLCPAIAQPIVQTECISDHPIDKFYSSYLLLGIIMRYVIETYRLILRPMVLDDHPMAYMWCSDPLVNRYVSYPLYRDPMDVRRWIGSIDYDDPDNYEPGIILKESNELIGSARISYHHDTDSWSIGYNLRSDMWGNGYAVEAVKGMIDCISKDRRVRMITGEFAVENVRSGRVMEKLGMHYLRDGELVKLDGSERFRSKIYVREFRSRIAFPVQLRQQFLGLLVPLFGGLRQILPRDLIGLYEERSFHVHLSDHELCVAVPQLRGPPPVPYGHERVLLHALAADVHERQVQHRPRMLHLRRFFEVL